MGQRGPKPDPVELKLIKGAYGVKPEDVIPAVVMETTDGAPAWMSPEQKEGWQHAVDNAPRGLLRRLDRTALTVWVIAEDTHRLAAEQLSKEGLLVKASAKPDAPMVQNPLLGVMNRQAELILRAVAELGFSPTSRSRIAGAGAGAAKTPTNRFASHAKKRA